MKKKFIMKIIKSVLEFNWNKIADKFRDSGAL
jgi:hypothetical protein